MKSKHLFLALAGLGLVIILCVWSLFHYSKPAGDDALTSQEGLLKSGDTISFGNYQLDKSELSDETIKWLEQYNRLSEEEQKATSYIPKEVLTQCGLLGTETSDENAKAD